MLVNDIHSALNATAVGDIHRPVSVAAVQEAVVAARAWDLPLAIAGGRHAMGGQQFGTGSDLLDMTGLARVLDFDAERGEVEAEAGIMWPALIGWLHEAQEGRPRPWGIIQKQTGADRLTLGGALSSNVHGRVLGRGPIVADVVAFTLADASGELRRCSREENTELFRLAIGGYGLFGPIVAVRLRLAPRRKMRRDVSVLTIDAVVPALEAHSDGGRGYGDFQFAIDPESEEFLYEGICSCYVPVDDATPMPETQRALSRADWESLACGPPPRLRCLYHALSGHRWPTVLVGLAPDGGLPRRIPPRARRAVGRIVARFGDDFRVVCAAARSGALHG